MVKALLHLFGTVPIYIVLPKNVQVHPMDMRKNAGLLQMKALLHGFGTVLTDPAAPNNLLTAPAAAANNLLTAQHQQRQVRHQRRPTIC